jgi:hypothetical protein
MKKQINLDTLSCRDMVELYQRKGSFENCAKYFGVSPNVWAMYWKKNNCEQYMENNNAYNYDIWKENSLKYSALWNTATVIASDYDNEPKEIVPVAKPEQGTITVLDAAGYAVDIPSKRKDHAESIMGFSDGPWKDRKPTKMVSESKDLYDPDSERFEIAVISDLHFGSTYQQLSALNNFVGICEDRDIRTLVNAGDIIEGLMGRPGHKNERFLHAIDDIEEYCVENYPDNFTNSYFIIGNHCATLGKRTDGYDIGANLVKDRSDLTYLEDSPSLPDIIKVDGGVKVQLYHGTGGCAKTRTGRTMNKSIELRTMGQEFSILLTGHCHSSSFVSNYMGTVLCGLPSFQALTPYLAGKGLVSECGGLILSYQVDYEGFPCRVIPEFVFAKELGGIHKNDF